MSLVLPLISTYNQTKFYCCVKLLCVMPVLIVVYLGCNQVMPLMDLGTVKCHQQTVLLYHK